MWIGKLWLKMVPHRRCRCRRCKARRGWRRRGRWLYRGRCTRRRSRATASGRAPAASGTARAGSKSCAAGRRRSVSLRRSSRSSRRWCAPASLCGSRPAAPRWSGPPDCRSRTYVSKKKSFFLQFSLQKTDVVLRKLIYHIRRRMKV